jgi:hypothetical protein
MRAITGRLDELAASNTRLHARLDGLEEHLKEMQSALDDLAGSVGRGLDTLEQRAMPSIRAILDEEAENRRRLHRLRAAPDYEAPHQERDPLVSIVIATGGRPELLQTRSLPSLLAQTHPNLEIVVVGDAAGPETRDAVLALGDERLSFFDLSQRITAHAHPRRHWLVGSTMARNEAARRARGSWLLHFDDDDRLRPDAVEMLLATARSQHAEVAYGGYEEHRPDGTSRIGMGFPPRLGDFSWAGALMHAGLRFFERELVGAALELPGDMYMLERMLRAGVNFALAETVVLDYYPSTLWRPDAGPEEDPTGSPPA